MPRLEGIYEALAIVIDLDRDAWITQLAIPKDALLIMQSRLFLYPIKTLERMRALGWSKMSSCSATPHGGWIRHPIENDTPPNTPDNALFAPF